MNPIRATLAFVLLAALTCSAPAVAQSPGASLLGVAERGTPATVADRGAPSRDSAATIVWRALVEQYRLASWTYFRPYTPVYDRDGYDQWGFDTNGYDREQYNVIGRNRAGLDRSEEDWQQRRHAAAR